MAHCYSELAVSSLAVAKATASTRRTYPGWDGEAEWTWEIPGGRAAKGRHQSKY